MTTSYSDLLRLAIQGDGDNPNTWGQIANGSVFELIEDAISGYLNLDISGQTTVTLTTGNGVPDQSRMAMLGITGSIINDVVIIVPTVTHKYVVNCNFSGAFKVTIKTSTGTGVDFDNTKRSLIICDGSNVLDIQPDLGDLAFMDTIVSADRLGNGIVTTSVIASAAVGLSQLDPSILSGFLPVGAPIFWLTSVAPVGYTLFDGTTLSRTGDGINLFAIWGTRFGDGDGSTTFNKPDWRNVFIRGWSVNSSVDPDGPRDAYSSVQLDAQQKIIGDIHITKGLEGVSTTGAFASNFVNQSAAGHTNLNLPALGDISFDSSLVVRTASENRPINKVSYYITRM